MAIAEGLFGNAARARELAAPILASKAGLNARTTAAYGMLLAGDTAQARKYYQGFLALWKDADPDLPLLQQAKAEYGRLL